MTTGPERLDELVNKHDQQNQWLRDQIKPILDDALRHHINPSRIREQVQKVLNPVTTRWELEAEEHKPLTPTAAMDL